MSTQKQNTSKRQAISLETKIKILDCLKRGEGPTSVGKKFCLNEATIRTIRKNEDSIRQSIISGSALSCKTSSYSRNPILEKTEKHLVFWIEDLIKKKIPVDGPIIKEKALRLFNRIQESEPSTSHQVTKTVAFNASDGWLTGFLKRHAFHSVKIKGEVASADVNAAKSFPDYLAKVIQQGGYTPDQIFNADETGLFWKKMSKKTYIAKSERSASGFKAAKDRLTFLLCSNASGDKMLKPLLINKSLMPRALRGKNIKQLPVHFMANKKAWMTTDLFTKWFNDCFVPEVQKYIEEKGLEFKILLLVDNAPSHPVVDHPNIQLLFLPPNTTSLIQPLDQGIIATFKMYYMKQTLKYIIDSVEEKNVTVVEAWKKFTILDCITHASLAIKQLRPSTLNACWKQILPACVKNDNLLLPNSTVCSEIIALANEIGGEGFNNMQMADIDELIQEIALTEDDLMEVMAVDDREDINNDEVESEVQLLTADLIREGLKFATSMEQHFLAHDPDMERALKFQRNLQFCVAGYRELYKQLEKPKKQQLITDFMPSTNPTEAINDDRSSSFESNTTILLDISDESNFGVVSNKRARLLSSDDE